MYSVQLDALVAHETDKIKKHSLDIIESIFVEKFQPLTPSKN